MKAEFFTATLPESADTLNVKELADNALVADHYVLSPGEFLFWIKNSTIPHHDLTYHWYRHGQKQDWFLTSRIDMLSLVSDVKEGNSIKIPMWATSVLCIEMRTL